uniref:Uncharacterized protein n=1 Tax=Populus alba TaxID=43335 RepID=A0A4U5QUU7_POPAL|nr:hypothetical protein D5086_0000043130 [Populus alba]
MAQRLYGLSGGHMTPTPTSVILEVASRWKRRTFIPFNSEPHPSFRMEDILSNLRLDCASICLPILNKKENRVIETILQGRSTLGPGGLDVVETLEKLLILPSDVRGLTNPSFQCNLAITRQMVFRTFIMCVHSKNRWAEEKRVMKEVIKQYRADKSKFHRLKEEKTHAMKMTEQRLVEAFNHIDLLERRMIELENKVPELRGARDTLKEEPRITREEVQKSCARMDNLKNSFQMFWSEYGESVFLT